MKRGSSKASPAARNGVGAADGIEVAEIPLTKHDVYIADECFLTGTAAEVVPVVKVDSRVIGDGFPVRSPVGSAPIP